jgi:hypothetical protein
MEKAVVRAGKARLATFRLIHFAKADRYVGLAWNYDEAVLISTRDHATYTEARAALQAACDERHVELRWFDGEYVCKDGETILPRE